MRQTQAMADSERRTWHHPAMSYETEVDAYGLPTTAFGDPVSPEFFEVLGRILAVHGKIEYLQDRLNHLPDTETTGSRKVEQFLARCRAERADRNAIVHSHWMLGAHTTNPEIILALRYKSRKQTSGGLATVSIPDMPESDREQDFGQYTLDDLKRVLRSNVVTMRIGEQAYTEIMLKWATQQIDIDSPSE